MILFKINEGIHLIPTKFSLLPIGSSEKFKINLPTAFDTQWMFICNSNILCILASPCTFIGQIPIFVYNTDEFILIFLLFKLCLLLYSIFTGFATNFPMFNSKLREDNKEVSVMLWRREWGLKLFCNNPVECNHQVLVFLSYSASVVLWVTQNNLFVSAKHAKCS